MEELAYTLRNNFGAFATVRSALVSLFSPSLRVTVDIRSEMNISVVGLTIYRSNENWHGLTVFGKINQY
jgi:hypothetical protein